MKVNFYFVRHGETLFNHKNRIQGVCDSPLTQLGIEQTKQAAKALENVYFHQAYTSPAERCVNTSKAILKDRYMKAEIEDGLMEFDFGKFEGSRFTSHPDEIRWCFEHRDFSKVNGESPKDCMDRINETFKRIIDLSEDGDNVLIVSHGFYELFVMHTLLGIDVDKYEKICQKEGRHPMPNAGIMAFTYEDGSYTYECLPTPPQEYRPLAKNKTLHFYYVRHGQTQFNMWNRMQGYSDSPLTEQGKDQARLAGQALLDIPFANAFVSSAPRTRKTASLILQGRKDVPITYTTGLKEVNFGDYEGVVTDSWREEIMRRHMEGETWDDVNGETGEDVKVRMLATLEKIISASKDGDNVLIVSHGTYYLNMLKNLFDLERADIEKKVRSEGKALMPNGGIFRFDYNNGKFELVELMVSPEDFKYE